MDDWSPFDKLSQQQYDNLNGSIVSSVFQTGQSVAKGRRLRLQMMHSKRNNIEYMPERHDPHLTYVYNKYSKAKFNCV